MADRTVGVVILLLGGTAEGRELASALEADGRPAVLSLAGRTADPLTAGPVRVGGFGGVEGLIGYLRAERVSAIVDATHPFAATMSRNAAEAARATGVPILRLERPGWADAEGASDWRWVDDHASAAGEVAALGASNVLLTVGRQHTLDYGLLADRTVIARVAEPPDGEVPERWRLLIARGPFDLAGERELFAEHRIDCLVTKDSGGTHTAAKLTAAAESGAAVVVVRRGSPAEGVTTVGSVDEALGWLSRV